MIAENVLISLGLTKSKLVVDQKLRYVTYDYSSNGSYISVCNMLNEDYTVSSQNISINDREILKSLTIDQIKNFIDIIN